MTIEIDRELLQSLLFIARCARGLDLPAGDVAEVFYRVNDVLAEAKSEDE